MKRLIGFFIAFALIISVNPALSDDAAAPETPLLESAAAFTPEDLLEIARRHNPDYQKTVQNATLSGIGIRSAWGTLLPSVDVGYQISQNNYYQPTYVNPDGSVSTYPLTVTEETYQTVLDTINGHVFPGWNPDSTVLVSAYYPVPEGKSRTSSGWVSVRETIRLGGQQYFGIKNAGIQRHVYDLQLSASDNALQFDLRKNYYAILAQKRLLELANRVLEQKKEQLRLARARFEVGSVTELDVLQAEIDVGNQENAVIEAENALKIVREELNRVIGVDLDSKFELVDNLKIFEPGFSIEKLIEEAIASRPDYLAYQEQEKYQRNLVRSRRGEFFPDLTASLTHSRSENSGASVDFTLNPRNRNTSMSLSLSWNLFSGFSDQAQYEESRVSLNNSRHDRKKQEQLVEQEVRQAYYALIQTYDQSRVTEKNRELASRQLELEQERYRLGATSQLNLRAAQVTYEQAESDHIANIFNFWSNLAALENAVGLKLQ